MSSEHHQRDRQASEGLRIANMIVGCAFLLGAGIIVAIVVVGYWATH